MASEKGLCKYYVVLCSIIMVLAFCTFEMNFNRLKSFVVSLIYLKGKVAILRPVFTRACNTTLIFEGCWSIMSGVTNVFFYIAS